jgi:hypothetical protein
MSPRQVPEEAPRGRQALRNHVIQQVCPEDELVAGLGNAGLDRQMQGAGGADMARPTPVARSRTWAASSRRAAVGSGLGKRRSLVSHGARPWHRVRPH